MQVGFPQKSAFDTLTANKIVVEEIDTAVGDLVVKRLGVTRVTYDGSFAAFQAFPKLTTAVNIVDQSGVSVFGTDDAGHIDLLGRVDADASSLADGFTVSAYLGEIVANGVGGLVASTPAYWQADANEIYYADLGQVIPIRMLNSNIRIDSVKLEYSTEVAGSFVDLVAIYEWDLTDDAAELGPPLNDGTDQGNGSTGRSDVTYTPGIEVDMSTDHTLVLYIETNTTGGYVRLHNIQIKFSAH